MACSADLPVVAGPRQLRLPKEEKPQTVRKGRSALPSLEIKLRSHLNDAGRQTLHSAADHPIGG